MELKLHIQAELLRAKHEIDLIALSPDREEHELKILRTCLTKIGRIVSTN